MVQDFDFRKNTIKAGGNASGKKRTEWLVSFGDLLTLLLCFILSLVCYGHIKPIPNNDLTSLNDSKIKNPSVTKSNHIQSHKVGTALALNREQEPKKKQFSEKLFFVATDFSESGELTPKAKAQLADFLATRETGQVLVRSCSEDAWHGALQYALVLRKELFKGDLERKRLQVELLGGNCIKLNVDGGFNVAALEVEANV